MSLNNQGRIQLERSGPWIGVAGLFFLLWIAIASSQYAPWWGVVLFVLLLIPGAVLVARLSRTHPKRAAFVPFGNLLIWFVITVVGLSFWGWKADPNPTTSAGRILTAECAAEFETLRTATQSDGNPGQPGRELTAEWDSVQARVTELSKDPKPIDCPRTLDSLSDRLDGIARLIEGSQPYDMALALAQTEESLATAEAAGDAEALAVLRNAIDALVVHGPKSKAELQTHFDAVNDVDPLDPEAIAEVLAELKSSAEANTHYQLSRQALDVMADSG